MPRADELAPRDPSVCGGCGEPLGAGPWWRLEGGFFHETCADWSRERFPYANELRRMAGLRRRAAECRDREVGAELLEAVEAAERWLSDARRSWPRDALGLIRGCGERLARMNAAAARAKQMTQPRGR